MFLSGQTGHSARGTTSTTGLFAVRIRSTAPVAQGNYSASFSLPASTAKTACEVVQSRTLNTGSDDYYAIDLMFPSNWQEPSTAHWGMVIAQFNYQMIIGAPVALAAYGDKVAIVVQAGKVTGGLPSHSTGPDNNGYAHCTTATCQVIPQGQLAPGTWHQVIVHIHWASDMSGSVETWWRRKGNPSWSQQARYSGPTVQWTTDPLPANYATTDKIGAYRGPSPLALSIRNDGYCRARTFVAAETCL